MPEINPLTKDQLFEKKIAENTGSNYNVGDISDVVPVTKDQSLLKEIALNSAGLSEAIEATQDMISDAYDSTHTYNVGDYCIYENVLYKCNTDSTTGTWDSSKWDAVTVDSIIKSILNTVNPLSNGILPFLTLGSLKGDSSDPINIDNINIGSGYIMRILEESGFSGTSPRSALGGANSYLLAGFSAMVDIQGVDVPVYGIQIAFGFATSTIAIRNAPYQQYSWNQWKQIIGS